MKIGVVAVQGDVTEHMDAAKEAMRKKGLQPDVIAVRSADAVASVDGLIIPGGESTTISRLLDKFSLHEPIKDRAEAGMPVMGTCAGLIMLAKKGDSEVSRTGTRLLGLMDMRVRRNAFGRQRESFETSIEIEGFSTPYTAVFIRAPSIAEVWGDCRALASFNNEIILARQKNLLACAFHPELTDDFRVHQMFLDMI